MKKIIRKWLGIDREKDFFIKEINKLTIPKFKVGETVSVYEYSGMFLECREKVCEAKILDVNKGKRKSGIFEFKYHLLSDNKFFDSVDEYMLESINEN